MKVGYILLMNLGLVKFSFNLKSETNFLNFPKIIEQQGKGQADEGLKRTFNKYAAKGHKVGMMRDEFRWKHFSILVFSSSFLLYNKKLSFRVHLKKPFFEPSKIQISLCTTISHFIENGATKMAAISAVSRRFFPERRRYSSEAVYC